MLSRKRTDGLKEPFSTLGSRVGEIARFSAVGLAASAVYFVVSNAMIFLTDTDPALSSVAAYIVGMFVSFVGQSRFTFRVERASTRHKSRFIVLSVLGLAISYGAVFVVVERLGQHPAWGTVLTVLFVPIASYILMKLWVFAPDLRE